MALNASRKIAGLMALFAVLLHAGSVFIHGLAMASARDGDPISGIVMCRGGDTAPSSSTLPQPADEQDRSNSTCPICSGAVPALAVLPPAFDVALIVDRASARHEAVADIVRHRLTPVCPPARGPPVVA